MVQSGRDVQHFVPARAQTRSERRPRPDPARNRYSLPELDDGRAGVSQVGAGQVGSAHGGVGQAGVGTVQVVEGLQAVGRVPFVVTSGPGEGGAKGPDQVVEAPGQNHDVISVAEKHDDHGGVAQTCTERRRDQNLKFHTENFPNMRLIKNHVAALTGSMSSNMNLYQVVGVQVRPGVWKLFQNILLMIEQTMEPKIHNWFC